MHIGIAGPIATADIAHLLEGDTRALPRGYGGAPLMATLIDALLKRGHQVTAFTTTHGHSGTVRAEGRISGKRFAIYYVPVRPRAFRPSGGSLGRAADFFSQERRALERAIREAVPDIIHAHWTYEFGLAAIASELPHVVTCHDAPQVVLRHMPNLYRMVRYLMARRCLALSGCLTAVSPYLRDRIAQYVSIPVTVIPNPLSPALTTRTIDLSRLPDPAAPSLAMAMNGWGKLKNPQPALRAFAKLRRQIPHARLKLYGADFGPGQHAEQWARRKGIAAGMDFIGPLPHARLFEELCAADILIHPSREETFGMAVAEAMALGIPVIGGQRSGAVPWLIGEAGALANIDDAQSMFDSLVALLGDRTRYAACRRSALERSRLFDAARVAEAYEAVYARCIHGAERTARMAVEAA